MLKKVLDFLAAAGTFYLATVEGDQPRVRPMGLVMMHDGRLCFSTNNRKPMFAQMAANPKVEFCAATPDGRWLRLSGTARFVTTLAAKQQALETMPMLKHMYSADDTLFEIFTLDNATATFQSMSGEKETIAL